MLKKLAHKAALRAELIAERLFHRTGDRRQVDPYIGYATPEEIVLRGRVLSKLRHATASEHHSKLMNLRHMVGMFLTDEVRDAVVSSNGVSTRTDEEGYFHLSLPRGARSGWSFEPVTVEGCTGTFDCPVMVPQSSARFMVISDIDDTMLETGAYSLVRNLYTSFTGNSKSRKVFPDAIELMNALSANCQNPVYYVSSSPWNLHDFLQDIFANSALVRGPMFLRDLGLSDTKFITEGHGNHKGASIDLILAANPDLPAILLGDTGQHDAAIYADTIDRNEGRIFAVGLRIPADGLDEADQSDLSRLKDKCVEVYAAPTFDGFLHTTRVHTEREL